MRIQAYVIGCVSESVCLCVCFFCVSLSLSVCFCCSPTLPLALSLLLFLYLYLLLLSILLSFALSLSLLYPFSLVDEVSRPALHWKSTFEEHIVEARKLEHHYPHALEISIRDPSTDLSKTTFQLSGFYYNVIQYCYVYCCHH